MPFNASHSNQEPESLSRSLARHSSASIDSPVDELAPIQFLVEAHEHETEDGGHDEGEDHGSAVDAEGDDWGRRLLVLAFRLRGSVLGGTHCSVAC